jgi:hypothetical protein
MRAEEVLRRLGMPYDRVTYLIQSGKAPAPDKDASGDDARSGANVERAFCARHGLATPSSYARRPVLQRRAADHAAFGPVQVAADAPRAQADASTGRSRPPPAGGGAVAAHPRPRPPLGVSGGPLLSEGSTHDRLERNSPDGHSFPVLHLVAQFLAVLPRRSRLEGWRRSVMVQDNAELWEHYRRWLAEDCARDLRRWHAETAPTHAAGLARGMLYRIPGRWKAAPEPQEAWGNRSGCRIRSRRVSAQGWRTGRAKARRGFRVKPWRCKGVATAPPPGSFGALLPCARFLTFPDLRPSQEGRACEGFRHPEEKIPIPRAPSSFHPGA